MKSLIHLAFLGTLTLGLGACGGNMVDDLSSWKDSACACKDKSCAEKQGKAFIKLTEKYKDADKPSKEDAKKLDKLADTGQECLETHGVDVFDLL
jgi:hypothetical protein